MTRIKLCGLTRECDIETANALHPDYVGFVFAKHSRRYVSAERAVMLRTLLHPSIPTVGVFVREAPKTITDLLESGIINIVQLHGGEDEEYISQLHRLTDAPIIKAFRIDAVEDIEKAQKSKADYVLLDSGSGGTGNTFDWSLIKILERPYFLAGGLTIGNVSDAVAKLAPFAVDVSSGIETNGFKDQLKMAAFVAAVRKEDSK